MAGFLNTEGAEVTELLSISLHQVGFVNFSSKTSDYEKLTLSERAERGMRSLASSGSSVFTASADS
jgi:hypothetical protein